MILLNIIKFKKIKYVINFKIKISLLTKNETVPYTFSQNLFPLKINQNKNKNCEEKMPKRFESRKICPILGEIYQPSCWKLFLKKDVVWYIFKSEENMAESGTKQIRHAKIIEIIAEKITSCWKASSIPILSTKRINTKLGEFYKRYRDYRKRCRDAKFTKQAAEKFSLESNTIFEIGACKCTSEIFCSCVCQIPDSNL